MRALVTGTMTPTGLFVVRRLKELGFEVTAGGAMRLDYALYSKAVKHRLLFPSPRYEPLRFVQAVLEELERKHYDIYIPTFEDGYLMSFYQEHLKRLTHFQMMPYTAILSVHDKHNMNSIARTIGIPTPQPTFRPNSYAALREAIAGVDFPTVVKLRKACNANGQQFVRDPRDLPAVCDRLIERYHLSETELPVIQRYITGPLISTVNLAQDGEVRGQVVFKALRVYPRTGGTSSLREVIRHDMAASYDRTLIAHLNWTGFFSVDYMCDEATGQLHLIDINPRLAPGVIFGHYAGTDLLGAYVDMLLGRPMREIAPPREGIMAKMHFLEVGSVLTSFLDRELRFRDKLSLWRSVLKAAVYPDDVFNWRDLMPFAALWTFIIPNLPRLLSERGGEVFLQKVLFDEGRFEREQGSLAAAATLEIVE